jgi:hypothetical protein
VEAPRQSTLAPRAEDFQPPAELVRLRNRSFLVGAVGVVLCAVGAMLDVQQFFRSYLVGWLYWVAPALGCLSLLMLHHMSRGAWGLMVRRPFEAAARTILYLAVLFVPIALGLDHIYEWTDSAAVAADHLLQHKAAYLNKPFFLVRSLAYFAAFSGLAFALSRLSQRQDDSGDPKLFGRMQRISGPGIVFFCLAITLAGVDWVMSLDAKWFSSLYGLYFLVCQGLAALAFITLVAVWLSRRPPMDRLFEPRHFHDYGKLMLAFVMIWAYFGFSQFLIIWSGNMPEEAEFYHRRLHGGWQALSLAVVLLHFVLPFALLLSRDLKRSARLLGGIAILVLAARWLDLYWQVGPSLHPDGATVHWLDLAATLAVGGLWCGLFFHELGKRTLIPVHDPFLAEALES